MAPRCQTVEGQSEARSFCDCKKKWWERNPRDEHETGWLEGREKRKWWSGSWHKKLNGPEIRGGGQAEGVPIWV